MITVKVQTDNAQHSCTYGKLVDAGKCQPKCDNAPTGVNCPALSDAGQNFGNGYYNGAGFDSCLWSFESWLLGADHHFHYGYIVYAAAVVAKFDPAWAAKHYEQVPVYKLL